jgi:hypothetical protein
VFSSRQIWWLADVQGVGAHRSDTEAAPKCALEERQLSILPQADQKELEGRVDERTADPLLGQPRGEMPRDRDLELALFSVSVGWLACSHRSSILAHCHYKTILLLGRSSVCDPVAGITHMTYAEHYGMFGNYAVVSIPPRAQALGLPAAPSVRHAARGASIGESHAA